MNDTTTPHLCTATHDKAHDEALETYVGDAYVAWHEEAKKRNLCPAALDLVMVENILDTIASNTANPGEFVALLVGVVFGATGLRITGIQAVAPDGAPLDAAAETAH